MALGKQAKTLSGDQIGALLAFVETTRHVARTKGICLLSVRAGLRAHEIAHVTWHMHADASGSVGSQIRLEDRASKGRSGRIIPLNQELREALVIWRAEQNLDAYYVVTTQRAARTSAQAIVNMFSRWYFQLRLVGCSSHSGRRTFITNAARKISSVGGSLRYVRGRAGRGGRGAARRGGGGGAGARRRGGE